MWATLWKDLSVLYYLITNPFFKSNDHQERLEHFYKHQAENYDHFRKSFLWGRLPLMRVCSAYLNKKVPHKNLVWIDLGGGTGSNVEIMEEMFAISHFKQIYIVDLCPSLCKIAEQRVKDKGWTNVKVVCGDACTFDPKIHADLVTFSYSLSMIPDFHKAIDNAMNLLKQCGVLGVTDFYVSSKYDKPTRQMTWFKRAFYRSWFDLDGIDIGPERRSYLEKNLETIHDSNNFGNIPYTFLKAPYYVWIGCKCSHEQEPQKQVVEMNKQKAPFLFPPTFLYHQSWEDPREDEKVLDLKETDVCLTLTSGGCNTLNLLLNNVEHVYSVDINPAQTALLELKCIAIRHLGYDDFWKLFGEGKHKQFENLYRHHLAPFLSDLSKRFWDKKKYYFYSGLYYHGSMGRVSRILHYFFKMTRIHHIVHKILHAHSLQEQKYIWDQFWSSRVFRNETLSTIIEQIFGMLATNKTVAWFAGGIPVQQLNLIFNDDNTPVSYFCRCIAGVFTNSHIRNDNYFYLNLLHGSYSHRCCPAYLKKENYLKLRDKSLDNLSIINDTFNSALEERMYDKVILMDHADWQSYEQTEHLSKLLYEHMNPGGKLILRSAALEPPYIEQLEKVGFKVECIHRIDQQPYLDRVNMYASFYCCTRT